MSAFVVNDVTINRIVTTLHTSRDLSWLQGSLVAAYKALSCLIYQCSEGNIPERPLYIFLDHTARIAIADAIIRALPAYETATWG